ncbi:hypothetical protein Scep_004080 [Stephania cephalantha]|uniref:Uncharacterized protein n=1 Tax=Stephania cephalantha TaxID=152367 RepID=A0AAP0KRR8_9MAGN
MLVTALRRPPRKPSLAGWALSLLYCATLFLIAIVKSLPGEAKLQRRCLELTQATLDQPVDDEAVYFNVAGECPKGRVYGLGSLGRKNRRYADPGASTFQMPEMVPRSEFDSVAEQLRQVVAFMQRQFGMTMDGASLSHHDHHHHHHLMSSSSSRRK